ncbi:hypothetical protein GWI33_012087, partial [Rhynchophorus ferrugineus]
LVQIPSKNSSMLDDVTARKTLDAKKLIRISDATEDKITVTIGGENINWNYGQEFIAKIVTGHQVNALAVRNGNTAVFKMSYVQDPRVFEEKVYQFTKDGIVAVSTSHLGITAVQKYIRVK